MKKKIWPVIAFIIMIAMIAVSGYAAYRVVNMNMLPTKYLAMGGAVLAVLILITVFLLFFGMNSRHRALRNVRRVIAVLLAVVITAGTLYVSNVATKVDSTVATVTDVGQKDQLNAVVGVYVRKDDAASSLDDVKDYTFAVMKDFDQDNTKRAEGLFSSKEGKDPATQEFSNAVDCANAVSQGTTNAMLLNESYYQTLSEEEAYANPSDVFKEIASFKIMISAKEKSENDKALQKAAEKPETWYGSENVTDVTTQPFAVYLAGADLYNDENTTSLPATGRNDVNIVMLVNPNTHQVLMVHVPRDLYIANPAINNSNDRLTLCGMYGVKNSELAISNKFKIHLNYYARMNFAGFRRLVNSIGGITIDNPTAFSTSDGSYSFKAGRITMGGSEALAYARERKNLKGADFARGENQMRVLNAIIHKLTTSGTTLLTNYSGILNSLAGMFETDMSDSDLSALVRSQLSSGAAWDTKNFSVTGSGTMAITVTNPTSPKWVILSDDTQIASLQQAFQKFYNNQALTDEDVASGQDYTKTTNPA